MEFEEDDRAWATRAGMWQSRVAKALAGRTKRAKAQAALILAGHGVSLRVENGALTIRNGFTHYPQKREIIRYFRGDVALPERIILLDGSGSISFDVLSWLAEQKVSFIRIDWKGDIVCVAGASGYSANSFRVRWQLETRETRLASYYMDKNNEKATYWAIFGARLGNADALNTLSQLWINGDAVFKSGYGPEKSSDNTTILRMLAEAGNAEKQFELGTTFEKRHQIADAMVWFEKAAASGNSDAVDALKKLKPTSENR